MYHQADNRAQQGQSHQQAYAGGCGHRSFWGRRGGPWGGPRGGGRPFGGGFRPVPVNIETTDASFVLTLFAAGIDKEHIQLAVQDDVLTIAYRIPEEQPGAGQAAGDGPAAERRYTRREFRNAPFERTFQLNGKVLVADITARYADGILTVTLPKNPAVNQPAQDISVS